MQGSGTAGVVGLAVAACSKDGGTFTFASTCMGWFLDTEVLFHKVGRDILTSRSRARGDAPLVWPTRPLFRLDGRCIASISAPFVRLGL